MIRLPKGILIAVEGIDGAGKTTQVGMLADRLAQVGLDVLCRKEPTAGKWGQIVRDSARTGRLAPEKELEAFINDRREHVAEVIRPALDSGQVVIIDRYYFSTAAYQGARGFDSTKILAMNEEFAPTPDLLVLLEVAPEVGVSRIAVRDGQGNHFEGIDQLREVAKQFDALPALPYLLRMDGAKPADELNAEILRRLYFGPVFRSFCFKLDSLSQCEPAFCAYGTSGSCAYPKMGPLAPVEYVEPNGWRPRSRPPSA